MLSQSLQLPEVLLLTPKVHSDERGYFFECFRQQQLQQLLERDIQFVQENQSRSSFGVLRGLHYQRQPQAQAKLVRVVEGEVLDVVVDIRHGSPRFGQTVQTVLSAENNHQLFIPHGFAHGFLVLSPQATVVYKVDNYYSAQHDAGLAYNDANLAINWPLSAKQLVISTKDQQQPKLSQLQSEFNWK
ncbi:dTDP-4-dehydrorhamnose 3,5-epimerase [Rheinheimera salexigens]|uniref:dTDP-4-dehydrorhamnose 3,5-epimerase n=1 Tax=Rheinheimera salexigens TaxID=1628148 RepID=A0A1E7Q4S9_9GAMM|nr:dTDP-4-dehydrorhamnose 3,5-epimerase [Rheinheimera salexigens]OEY69202.1 dTDP-4-dehydrorhamnose 3,5-epimerase [Rheinheimera salexigens]